jgi:transcriptional regulator with XRE-family HTH domain
LNIENYITGTKLKEFRKQSGFSLAEAAEAVGVSSAFISMVENGKSGISFQKIHQLVTLYGKNLSDLTETASIDSNIINLNAAAEIVSEPGVQIFGLAKFEDSIHMGGFRLYFSPGAKHKFDYHAGYEYVLVLEGDFELHLLNESGEREIRTLHAGDTTVYSSYSHHSFKNIGDKYGSLFIIEAYRK